jgi:hypothetical protein
VDEAGLVSESSTSARRLGGPRSPRSIAASPPERQPNNRRDPPERVAIAAAGERPRAPLRKCVKSSCRRAAMAMAAPGERRSAGDSNPSRGATPTDTFLRGTRHLAASTLRSATVRQAGLHHSHVRNDFHFPVEWRCWTSIRSRSGYLAAGVRLTHAARLHRHLDGGNPGEALRTARYAVEAGFEGIIDGWRR